MLFPIIAIVQRYSLYKISYIYYVLMQYATSVSHILIISPIIYILTSIYR